MSQRVLLTVALINKTLAFKEIDLTMVSFVKDRLSDDLMCADAMGCKGLMSKTHRPTCEPAECLIPGIKRKIQKEQFRVFVLGPYCRPDEVVEKPVCPATEQAEIEKHAKYLRHATKMALEKEHYTVDFGETKSAYDAWRTSFEVNEGDLASFELEHAENSCQAIVIFPSSIGSICELALFAPRGCLAKMSIAIIHSQFEHTPSFFRDGIIRVFDQENGKPKYSDYADHDKCIQLALDFVEDKWSSFHRNLAEARRSVAWVNSKRSLVYERGTT